MANNIVEGTSGDDLINGAYTNDPEGETPGAGDNTVQAGDGNDTIVGSGGSDSLDGGTGRDTYQSGAATLQQLGYRFTAGDGGGFVTGSAIASAGDVDGDGIVDLLIGQEGGGRVRCWCVFRRELPGVWKGFGHP